MRTIVLVFCSSVAGSSIEAVAPSGAATEQRLGMDYTGPLFDEWEATREAVVTVEGTRFTAKLFDSDHPTLVRFTLMGTVQKPDQRPSYDGRL
jgi:hypothetical protein